MRMKKLKWLALILAVVLGTTGVAVMATDQTARLKESLKDDPVYTSVPVDTLAASWKANTDSFRKQYADRHVFLTGEIRSGSVASNSKQITLYSTKTGDSVTVDMSGQSEVALSTLKVGDKVNIYGQISVSWIFTKSYKINAKHAELNSGMTLTTLSRLFYPAEIYDGVLINDIAADKHVTFKVPETWKDNLVCSRLTNNGIQGYQFSLNVLPPQDTEYPEIFYIFYFDDETYLEQPPSDPTDGDNKDIEEVIIENILEELEDDFNIKVSSITTANGKELHYASTTYRPKDRNDYRLEFVFLPEDKGITCMLYLYYPRASAVNHLREVTYVIETLEN